MKKRTVIILWVIGGLLSVGELIVVNSWKGFNIAFWGFFLPSILSVSGMLILFFQVKKMAEMSANGKTNGHQGRRKNSPPKFWRIVVRRMRSLRMMKIWRRMSGHNFSTATSIKAQSQHPGV